MFLIWAAYAFCSLLYLSIHSKTKLFEFKTEQAMYLAQLMCLHTVIDAICLLYMSLATFCAIKLCLTGTWKVSIDPQTS